MRSLLLGSRDAAQGQVATVSTRSLLLGKRDAVQAHVATSGSEHKLEIDPKSAMWRDDLLATAEAPSTLAPLTPSRTPSHPHTLTLTAILAPNMTLMLTMTQIGRLHHPKRQPQR